MRGVLRDRLVRFGARLRVRRSAGRRSPEFQAPEIRRLAARTLRVYEAPEADQGVAADARHFYAVDNTVIAKYEIASGRRVARWVGPPNGLIRHMNSCLAERGRLWCANSNYPLTPMGSSVEVFDTAALDHVDSHSLGMLDEGSLTWFDRYRAGGSPASRTTTRPAACRSRIIASRAS